MIMSSNKLGKNNGMDQGLDEKDEVDAEPLRE
jgi:hypothetical protein